jgi:hypothetical protein
MLQYEDPTNHAASIHAALDDYSLGHGLFGRDRRTTAAGEKIDGRAEAREGSAYPLAGGKLAPK